MAEFQESLKVGEIAYRATQCFPNNERSKKVSINNSSAKMETKHEENSGEFLKTKELPNVIGTKNRSYFLGKFMRSSISLKSKENAKEQKKENFASEENQSNSDKCRIIHCINICRNVKRSKKNAPNLAKSSDQIGNTKDERLLSIELIDEKDLESNELEDERDQNGGRLMRNEQKDYKSGVEVIQLVCEQDFSTSSGSDSENVRHTRFDRTSRYSEGDVSNHLTPQSSLDAIRYERPRAQSTLICKTLKSPKVERRPLNMRRNAICEEIERDMFVQGLSLREWRKIILTNYSLIDFDLRF